MPNNFSSLIILLFGVLLLALNQYYFGGQIPSWVFILILVVYVIEKFRTFRKMRKK